MPLFRVEKLVKSYQQKRVVDQVDYQVDRAELVGLLGTNGAGKTTSFRMAVGLIRPEEGRVFLEEEDVTRDPIHIRARKGIGYLAQEPSVFQGLTVFENLVGVMEMLKFPRKERNQKAEEGMVEFGLIDHRDKYAKNLSGGLRRRLEIARTLLLEPKLLLLDEPTNGLDPEGIMAMRELIRDLPQRIDATVFLSSHLLGEVEEVADSIALLRGGKLIAQGKLSELGGTSARLKITVDRRREAMSLLLERGLRVEPGSAANDLCVTYDRLKDTVDPADLNRSLVSAGIGVSSLAQERLGLEHLYREVMGQRPEQKREAA